MVPPCPLHDDSLYYRNTVTWKSKPESEPVAVKEHVVRSMCLCNATVGNWLEHRTQQCSRVWRRHREDTETLSLHAPTAGCLGTTSGWQCRKEGPQWRSRGMGRHWLECGRLSQLWFVGTVQGGRSYRKEALGIFTGGLLSIQVNTKHHCERETISSAETKQDKNDWRPTHRTFQKPE